MIRYSYEVSGVAADDQTWFVEGSVTLQKQGDFYPSAFEQAMRAAFMKLTAGKAEYGKPGVGCVGPYTVVRFEITLDAIVAEEDR